MFIQNDQNEKSKVLIDLFVMNGARIYSQNFSDVKANEKIKLNFKDNLPTGIYLLKVNMDGQHSFRKVIKY
ncbi:MAG: T9SS type A sorting domain-containing protein [Bacteroidetes bacterium]|nr:T9SS type A sorting domain-containing protein [Bacteroidota bacterium]